METHAPLGPIGRFGSRGHFWTSVRYAEARQLTRFFQPSASARFHPTLSCRPNRRTGLGRDGERTIAAHARPSPVRCEPGTSTGTGTGTVNGC
jgi:hypothetical protein